MASNYDGDFPDMSIQGATGASDLGVLKVFSKEVRQAIYRQFFLGDQLYINHDYNKGGKHEVPNMKAIDTAILYVNKAISIEASYIMYRDIKVVLRAADIFGLYPKYQDLTVGTSSIWRFDPTKGTGSLQKNGETIYSTKNTVQLPSPPCYINPFIDIFLQRYLDPSFPPAKGELYPHMFAKIRHVCLDLRMDLLINGHRSMPCPALLMDFKDKQDIDTIVTVNAANHANYIKHMQRTKLFQSLARILRNSRRIELLEIMIGVCNPTGRDYVDDRYINEQAEWVMCELENAKNLEVFLEAGVCDKLSVLTNVRVAKVSFHVAYVEWVNRTGEIEGYMAPEFRNKGRELEEMIVRGFARYTKMDGAGL